MPGDCCISIFLINDCLPFNSNTIKSSFSGFSCFVINGNIRITTLVMQDGFMKGLFGIETTGPMLAFLPVITIGILFWISDGL